MSEGLYGILLWIRLIVTGPGVRHDDRGIVAGIIAALVIIILVLIILLLVMMLV